MPDLAYTTAEQVTRLVGQLGVDLRTDDADPDALMGEAIDFASGEIDWYCSRFAGAELAVNRWVGHAAAVIAVRWLCVHRLNEIPASLQKMWEEDLKPKLDLIQQGKAVVPGAAASRRPCTVTNQHVDLRRWNNQVRTDRARSTGVAKDYKRPVDPSAPDQR
jgi:hypothetical protein